MWLRVYFTISHIEGSVNTNTFPTACSADESCNAPVCWRFIWEGSFLLGSGFAVRKCPAPCAGFVVQVCTEAYNTQPETCGNLHSLQAWEQFKKSMSEREGRENV